MREAERRPPSALDISVSELVDAQSLVCCFLGTTDTGRKQRAHRNKLGLSILRSAWGRAVRWRGSRSPLFRRSVGFESPLACAWHACCAHIHAPEFGKASGGRHRPLTGFIGCVFRSSQLPRPRHAGTRRDQNQNAHPDYPRSPRRLVFAAAAFEEGSRELFDLLEPSWSSPELRRPAEAQPSSADKVPWVALPPYVKWLSSAPLAAPPRASSPWADATSTDDSAIVGHITGDILSSTAFGTSSQPGDHLGLVGKPLARSF
jgi:hypothetical protein